MWRDQSDRFVCNQHYVSTYEWDFSHDYETLINDALRSEVDIVYYSIYDVTDPIPEK